MEEKKTESERKQDEFEFIENKNMTFGEKMKTKTKNINLKGAIRAFTLILVTVLIVFVTVAQIGLDPTKFNFYTWISNIILLVSFAIFGMIMGESMGSDKQQQKANGLYQTSLKEFNKQNELIQPIALYFGDFLSWFTERETYNKRLDYLLNQGLVDGKQILKYVKEDDLQELSQHPLKFDDAIIRKKTPEQIEKIKKAIDGSIRIQTYGVAYYMNALENCSYKSELDLATKLNRDIKLNKHFNRTMKIISMIVFSVIWSMLTVSEFMKGDDVTAWLNLISRLTTLFLNIFGGWLTATIDTKIRARMIINKTKVLKLFQIAYESKEFTPEIYSDKARKEYEEYQNSITKTEVVEPDVSNDNVANLTLTYTKESDDDEQLS